MQNNSPSHYRPARLTPRVVGFVVSFVIALAGCSRQPTTVGLPPRPDVSAFPAGLATAVAETESELRNSPGQTAAWSRLGHLYHANGFYAEARQCYQELVAMPGAAPRACYGLAQTAQFTGDLNEQIHWLEATLRLEPGYVPAHLLLAEARFKSGDPVAALAGYQAVLQRDSGNPDALLGLAREHLRIGDDTAAARVLEDLIAKHPRSSSGHALLAQVVERRGDTTRAAVLREQARFRKDPPPAAPWMDDVMRSCFDVQRLGIRFEDAVKSGRVDDAVASLQQLEAIDPTHWIVCNVRALAAAQQGRMADAAREYERALAAGGDTAKIYPALVAALASMQRLAEAEVQARAGLRALPGNPDLLVALAELRQKQNDAAEARQLLAQVLAVDAQHVAAHRALSRNLWDAGQREQAVAHLEIIRKVSASDVPARGMLGQYHMDRNKPEQAIAPLSEAFAVEPGNEPIADLLALAHLRLGNRAAQQGQLAEAVHSYDAARAVRPQMAEVYANQVQVLLLLRQFDRAEESMRQLAALRPDNPAVYVSLGDIQNSAGRTAAALESWRKALQVLGDHGDRDLRGALAERLSSLEPQ
jgi:tetratricopeptide (TPR) repeat protein